MTGMFSMRCARSCRQETRQEVRSASNAVCLLVLTQNGDFFPQRSSFERRPFSIVPIRPRTAAGAVPREAPERAESKTPPRRPAHAIGAVLDLAPPFRFLDQAAMARLSECVRRFGVQRVQIADIRHDEQPFAIFGALSAKAPHVYIADPTCIACAGDALDEFISDGTLEERIAGGLSHPDLIGRVVESCGLARRSSTLPDGRTFGSCLERGGNCRAA
jgi:hypothetical protein